jgi:hypothetical protein
MAGVGNSDGDVDQGTFAGPDSRRTGTRQRPVDIHGADQRESAMGRSVCYCQCPPKLRRRAPLASSAVRGPGPCTVNGQDNVLSVTEAHRARLDLLPMLGRTKRR